VTQMYRYFQRTGGEEAWEPIQANQPLDHIKPTFITVLTLDTLLEKDAKSEVTELVKYQGPLYFDLDSDDVTYSIAGAIELLEKLKEHGIEETDIEVYLSGKKGLHILVPQECFMDKVIPLVKLPAVYKEIAFKMAVDTMDFAVYTAKKGRMLRTCFNIRENGNYRVPVTAAELLSLTPETYTEFCKEQRYVTPRTPQYRPRFALVFDAAKQKIAQTKKKKSKPVDAATLKQHEPTVKRLMDGETNGEVSFNKAAIQLALYAREAHLNEDQLVAACQGLINTHQSDGTRYNTPNKRERELRRMVAYVEDNGGYDYSIGPIRSMLAKEAVPEGFTESDEGAFSSTGVAIEGGRYLVLGGDSGDKRILDATFQDIEVLRSVSDESILCLTARLVRAGADTGNRVSIERADFTSSASLHRLVSGQGLSFTGSDIHARGIYEIMLRYISKKSYAVESEGVNIIKVRNAEEEELREGVVAWVDSSGVRMPDHVKDYGYNFTFQGYPSPEGVLKTDLSYAPNLVTYLKEPENYEAFKTMIVSLIHSQSPSAVAKLLGWCIACFWRPMFHEVHGKFPLLHINGSAGAGKTEFTSAMARLFYHKNAPFVTSPSSTTFSTLCAIAGSSSIPVIIDEYKPTEMGSQKHGIYKGMFRDAYNMRDTARGGGNRTKDAFNALNVCTMSAPIIFLAEAMETETALLERVVLLTLTRPSSLTSYKTYGSFAKFKESGEPLSALGLYFANIVSRRYNKEQFRAEFNEIYNQNRERHLIIPGLDMEAMSEDDFKVRASNRERSVYNYSVALFGIRKLEQVLRNVFKDEFDAVCGKWFAISTDAVFARMGDINATTVPEYIKVLQIMSDITRIVLDGPAHMRDGFEYALYDTGGFKTIHLAVRPIYSKYRSYCRTVGVNPLFYDDGAFAHALRDSPYFIRRDIRTRALQTDTVVLDYESLLRAGVETFQGRFTT